MRWLEHVRRALMRWLYGGARPDDRFYFDWDAPDNFDQCPRDEHGRAYIEPAGRGSRMYVLNLRPQLRTLRRLDAPRRIP